MQILPLTLLKIRLLQIRRELTTLSWLHKLLFSIILIGLGVICHQAFLAVKTGGLVLAGFWGAAVAMQVYRPDKDFVFLHLEKPRQAILAEYLAFSLPFILSATFTPTWFYLPIFIAGLLPITAIRFQLKLQTRFQFLGKVFPPSAFEYISGFRQSLPWLVFIYSLALVFCWVKILPVALLWLFCGTFLGFYLQGEPLSMLRANNLEAKIFLRKKVWQMVQLLAIFCFPVILLQTLFHPWLGLAGLLFFALQTCVLTFAIFMKYSTYEPDKTSSSNLLLLGFAQMSVVLPFFLLVPVVIAFRQYRKAKQNLTFFLNPC